MAPFPTIGPFPALGAVPPIQNPLSVSSQDEKTLKLSKEQRAALTKLQQTLIRAQLLKEQPLYAQGPGPLGIMIGQGPGGWAPAIGSAIAGVLAKKAHEKAAEEQVGATGELGPATADFLESLFRGAPNGLYGTGYGSATAQPPGPQLQRPQQPVYQGSPLMHLYDPLGLGPGPGQ